MAQRSALFFKRAAACLQVFSHEIEASDVAVLEAPCSQAALLKRHFEAGPSDSQSSDLAELLPSPSVPLTVTPGGPVVARLAVAGGCVTVLERRADQVRVLIDREDDSLVGWIRARQVHAHGERVWPPRSRQRQLQWQRRITVEDRALRAGCTARRRARLQARAGRDDPCPHSFEQLLKWRAEGSAGLASSELVVAGAFELEEEEAVAERVVKQGKAAVGMLTRGGLENRTGCHGAGNG